MVTQVLPCDTFIDCNMRRQFFYPLPFSEGLNAEYVKGENMEAVVTEEPQGEEWLDLLSFPRGKLPWVVVGIPRTTVKE